MLAQPTVYFVCYCNYVTRYYLKPHAIQVEIEVENRQDEEVDQSLITSCICRLRRKYMYKLIVPIITQRRVLAETETRQNNTVQERQIYQDRWTEHLARWTFHCCRSVSYTHLTLPTKRIV